jgi:hypothetical protein
MPEGGLSNIRIDGERLLVLQDMLGMEGAKALANEYKTKAFGMLSNLLSRPKSEDIDIVYEEKRYEAFWHVLGRSRYEYKRRKTYHVPVAPEVKDVELLGTTASVNGQTFEVSGIERCIEEYREEEIVDAQTGRPGAFSTYLRLATKQIDSTEALTADGTPIVALEAKPAFLVRKVVNTLVKPIQADQILDEQIGINELSLYFIPVYTFELLWRAKDKRVTISYDGATRQMRPQANKIAERLRTSFTNAELFEFGKEVANFVPGGGLAMMVGKKAIELYEK